MVNAVRLVSTVETDTLIPSKHCCEVPASTGHPLILSSFAYMSVIPNSNVDVDMQDKEKGPVLKPVSSSTGPSGVLSLVVKNSVRGVDPRIEELPFTFTTPTPIDDDLGHYHFGPRVDDDVKHNISDAIITEGKFVAREKVRSHDLVHRPASTMISSGMTTPAMTTSGNRTYLSPSSYRK
jgi:hypothetical protein